MNICVFLGCSSIFDSKFSRYSILKLKLNLTLIETLKPAQKALNNSYLWR